MPGQDHGAVFRPKLGSRRHRVFHPVRETGAYFVFFLGANNRVLNGCQVGKRNSYLGRLENKAVGLSVVSLFSRGFSGSSSRTTDSALQVRGSGVHPLGHNISRSAFRSEQSAAGFLPLVGDGLKWVKKILPRAIRQANSARQ